MKNQINILISMTFLLCFACLTPSVLAEDPYNPFSDYYFAGLHTQLDWCENMNIDLAQRRNGFLIIDYEGPVVCNTYDKFDQLIDDITNEFQPRGIRPWDGFSFRKDYKTIFSTYYGNPNVLEYQDVIAFYSDTDNKENIEDWLDCLQEELETFDESVMIYRYRFENEANYHYGGYPEVYYEAVKGLYDLINPGSGPKRLHADSTLSISLVLGNEEGVSTYLKAMLDHHMAVHNPTWSGPTGPDYVPLPFDGIEYHATNPNYMMATNVYNAMKALFQSVLPASKWEEEWDRMVFWSCETSHEPIGVCPTKPAEAYFYNSDYDIARNDIKNITQFLSLPNVIQTNIDRRFDGFMYYKARDNGTCLNGLTQDGSGIFDRGRGFYSKAGKSLELYTRYFKGYKPEFNNDTAPLRIFTWEEVDPNPTKRLLVWNDRDKKYENETINLPVEWRFLLKVWSVNLITFEEKSYMITGLAPKITLPVGIDPIVLTPSLELGTGGGGGLMSAPDSRAGIFGLDQWGDSTWSSELTLVNTSGEMVSAEITAFDSEGTAQPFVYEMTLLPCELLRRDVAEIWPAFRGSLSVKSTEQLTGFLEYKCETPSQMFVGTSPIQHLESELSGNDYIHYLTQDWETWTLENSAPFVNQMIITNPNDEVAQGNVFMYGPTGELLSTTPISITMNSQYIYDIEPSGVDLEFGKIEVQSDLPLGGRRIRI